MGDETRTSPQDIKLICADAVVILCVADHAAAEMMEVWDHQHRTVQSVESCDQRRYTFSTVFFVLFRFLNAVKKKKKNVHENVKELQSVNALLCVFIMNRVVMSMQK